MILQRYILRELIGSFVFAFCTLLSLLLIGTVFQVMRSFPGAGLQIVVKGLPLAIGSMASWVMLVASCTSSTLVYARLAAENEITAMRTCGIHIWRIISPAVLLGLLLVGASYPLNEIVVPWARMGHRMLIRETSLDLLKEPPPGAQDFKLGVTRILYTDFKDGRMIDPKVSKYHDHIPVMELRAASGTVVIREGGLQIVMSKPTGWRTNERGQRESFSSGGDLFVDVPPEKPLTDAQRQLADQPSRILWEKYFATNDAAERNPILMVLHTRYAASLAPMLLVLVAMPIGILVRRGSRLAGLGAALPPLLIYFVCYFLFQGLGDKSRVSAVLAAYAPNLFLGTLALLLLWGIARR
jgi:lipopolysaccharide export system permease protein